MHGTSVRRAVSAVVLGLGSLAAQSPDPGQFVRQAEAMGVRTGVCVLDLDSGRVAYQVRADEVFAPASNQKVLTAVSALRALRADASFTTGFRLAADVLEVEAGGDPNLCTDDGDDPLQVFAAVAAGLRRLGVDRLRGVRLLRGAFVGPSRPADWPADQLGYAYCAPTGAAVVECGCFRVQIAPTGGRDAALTPAASTPFPISGSIRMTTDRRAGARYGLFDAHGTLRASGHYLRDAGPITVQGAVEDPEAVFVRALVASLRRDGIRVDSDEELPAALRSTETQQVYVHRTALRTALEPMLQDSSNFHAEQVFRAIGARLHGLATFPSAARAVRDQLGALVGPLPDAVVVADGSGLSRTNRTTPRVLGAALQAALRDPQLRVIYDCLPQPGDGTLRERFHGSNVAAQVRAKTGWIAGASALTGVVGDRVFAILMNYDRKRAGLNARLKRLQERIVEAIADHAG